MTLFDIIKSKKHKKLLKNTTFTAIQLAFRAMLQAITKSLTQPFALCFS